MSVQYSKSTKLKLYQRCVVSTLLYGPECWGVAEKDLSKLRSSIRHACAEYLNIVGQNNNK